MPLPKLKIHHRPGALGRRFQIAIPTTKPLDGPLCNGIFAVSFFLPTYERFLVGPDSQLVDTITQGSGVFRECPLLFLIEAVEAEGFGGGGVVTPSFGNVQVTRIFDGRDDRGADGGQVDGAVAGPAGRGVLVKSHVPDVLWGSEHRN